MLYGDYTVKTLLNAESNFARLIIGDTVIKVKRRDSGPWSLDSVKFVKKGEVVIDPTWKTDKTADRLPDLTEANEADLLDDILLCVEDASTLFGVVQKVYEQ